MRLTMIKIRIFSFVLSPLIALAIMVKMTESFELGQLKCADNSIYPDEKLIGLVMQKCQPKLDDPKEILIACVTKCVLKKLKAITKKGKLKKEEAEKLIKLLPDGYQDQGKEKFEECFKKFGDKVKKESKCTSWVPFSSCFVGFAETLCKKNATTEAP